MIIATRTLTLAKDGATVAVLVSIAAPVAYEGFWSCAFEIAWPDGPRRDEAKGFDGVQALYLAMQKIAAQLYMSEHHLSGALAWDKPGAGYGFPISRGGRDLLIGEDKRSQV